MLAALLCLLVAGSAFAEVTVHLRYYGDISCAHCDQFVEKSLPELADRYGVRFDVDAFDVMRPELRADATRRLEELGLEYRVPPVLFIGNNAYQGNHAIGLHLPQEIEHLLAEGEFRPFDRSASETRLGDAEPVPIRSHSTVPAGTGVLRFFWGVGCPHCEDAKPFIERLAADYPGLTVEQYEVLASSEHHDLFRETVAHYGSRSLGVPQFYFEEHGWIGFNASIAARIEEAVSGRLPRAEIELPLFGSIAPGTVPVAAMTAAIAFVDGFNPCSLWVLTLLLGLIVHTRSRARILLVGAVFLAVTAAVYGVFMLGMFNLFAIAGAALALRIVVALIAVAMGAINVKDYFAWKKGVSLTIPRRFTGWIAERSRALTVAARSIPVLVGMTVVFAAGIALVELPCTAGFPVIWSRYVADTVSGTAFWGLLGLYLLVYLSIEVAVVAVALVTLGRIAFGESKGRVLKLLGGSLMVSLGLFYLADPGIASSIGGVGLIFAAAAAGAAMAAGAAWAVRAVRIDGRRTRTIPGE